MASGRIRFRSAVALVVGVIGLAGNAQAGVDSWDLTPLQGGSVRAIAVDPANPNRMLAALPGGVFLSEDGGATWRKIHSDPNQVPVVGSDGAVYLGGLYRSEDSGGSWQILRYRWPGTDGVAMLPGNPDTLYAATWEGLFRSTDRSQSWTYLGGNGLFRDDTRTIVIDPEDHHVLLVGTTDGIYRSENGGASWSQTNMGNVNRNVYPLVIAPNASGENQVWAGTSDGVRRSEDSGRTWVSSGLAGSGISALLWVAPNKLYAARNTTGNSLFLSTDGGQTWSPVTGLPDYAKVQSLAYTDHLYAGVVGMGIYQQLQSGWEATNQGLGGLVVNQMVKSPLDPGVYLGTEAGVLRYDPQTHQVLSLTSGMGKPYVNALSAGDEGGGVGVLFAATEGVGVLKLALPLGGSPSWTAVEGAGQLPLTVGDLGMESSAPDTLFAVAESRLYRSGNGGADWQLVSNIIPSSYGDGVRLVETRVDPQNHNQVVYVGTHQGRVFRSTDGGRSWSERNTNWCIGNCGGVQQLWIDPESADQVYVTNWSSLWRSDNGGSSWQQINNGALTAWDVNRALVYDSTNPRRIFTCAGGQVFRSFDRGGYWQDTSLPINNSPNPWWGAWISALAFAGEDSLLFASQPGWVMEAKLSVSGPLVSNFWYWRGGGAILPGEPLDLRAQVTAGDTTLTSVQVLVRPQPNEPPVATVTLNDNGIAPDTLAGDGTFSGRWAGTSQVGGYNLDLVAEDVVGRQNTQWQSSVTVAHTILSIPNPMLVSPEQLLNTRLPLMIEDDGSGYLHRGFLSAQFDVDISNRYPDNGNWFWSGEIPQGLAVDTVGTGVAGQNFSLAYNTTLAGPLKVHGALAGADSVRMSAEPGPAQKIFTYVAIDSLMKHGNPDTWHFLFAVVGSALFDESPQGVATSCCSDLRLGRGDIDTSRTIDSFDASLVLMQTVGKIDLYWAENPRNDPVEATHHFRLLPVAAQVAEVSGQMGITALDAALIMRRDVGIISHFPVEEGYYRLWDPPAPGSWWNPPNAKPVVAMVAPRLNRVVSLGVGSEQEEGRLAVPVLIDQFEGVLAGSLVLGFDPGQLQVVGVEPGVLTSGYLWEHQVEGGELRVAFAGAESRPGSGVLAQVRFARAGVGGEEVVLRQSQLNEEAVVYHQGTAVSAVVPGQLVLQANYPNPFNPSTAIGYELPGNSQVRLGVYSLLGQRIRLLVDERQVGGMHQVVWDGRDGQGRLVASGVYLYRLETEGGVLVRRMLLLK